MMGRTGPSSLEIGVSGRLGAGGVEKEKTLWKGKRPEALGLKAKHRPQPNPAELKC